MRKGIIVALGLASLGAFTQAAFAAPNCNDTVRGCLRWTRNEGVSNDEAVKACGDVYARCVKENVDAGFGGDGKRLPAPGSSAGGSKPKPGTLRTADGGTIMVTPEGKEWVWNGKYNLVASYEHDGKIPEYHSVMQGDPDAPSRMVNGKMMKVSDPRYQAEADAAVAKQKAEQDAKNAAAQKAASKQTKETIDAAKDPNGILKRDGTKIIKEDVDDPRSRSGQNGANSSASKAAANAHSSAVNPASATAGSASIKFKPPASAPVTAPPVTAPPVVASGIDRRPGRNAQ